jgi:plasmid stability protein
MAQVLIRGLDPEVVEKLKARAKRNGRSLEAELRLNLQRLAEQDDPVTAAAHAERLRATLKGRRFSDSTELIREDRER